MYGEEKAASAIVSFTGHFCYSVELYILKSNMLSPGEYSVTLKLRSWKTLGKALKQYEDF